MKETAERRATRERQVRNSAIAKIHLAKKKLGLDDAEYRALLKRIAGVTSAAELTADGQALVLDEFKRLGWKPGAPKGAGRVVRESDEPQIRMIRGLWLELRDLGALRDESQRALSRFCKRVAGVEAVEWLDARGAGKVIAGLSQWIQRVKQTQTESA
jgi:phage gp16-like protein